MSKITYIEDLSKELEKEFGLSEEEAFEICKLNIDHVYDLMQDPDVVTIRFPMLGSLYFNLKRAKYAKVYSEFMDLVLHKVRIVTNMVRQEKDLAHGRNSYFTIIRKYFYPKVEDRIKASREDVYQKIENKQNG